MDESINAVDTIWMLSRYKLQLYSARDLLLTFQIHSLLLWPNASIQHYCGLLC